MTVTLTTGLPGAGKSLSLVDQLIRLREKQPNRRVFAHGIDGLRPGIADPIDDISNWSDCPHGSIFVIDECQQLMPTDRGNTPEWIRDLSKHRHYGMDFLLATQHPALISTYVRRLVGEHIHLRRKFGAKLADRFKYAKCMDDPEAPAARKQGIRGTWRYPQRCFDMYESASVHTIKRKIPFRVYVMLSLVAVAVLAALAVPVMLKRFSHRNAAAIDPVHHQSASSSATSRPVSDSIISTDYVRAMTPRFPSMPWTAPAYDHREVKSDPHVYCIAMNDPPKYTCKCVTEQGTTYHMPKSDCRSVARNGVYDPYDAPPQDNTGRDPSARGQGELATPSRAPMDSRPSSSGVIAGHAAGVGSQVYNPPSYQSSYPFEAIKVLGK